MTVLNPVSYLQNRTDHTGQTDRLSEAGLLLPNGAGNTWRSGCRGAGDLKVIAQGTPNMTVAVAAGQCFVPVSSALHGTYHLMNDASFNVTITAAHASLPRNDLIIARVDDAFFSGAVNAGSIVVVTGTAAASPVDPAVAGSYILLARVVVAAAVTSITNAAITDLRAFTTGLGGVLQVATTAERDALTDVRRGQLVDNLQTLRLERWNGSAWVVQQDGTDWTVYTPTIVGTASPTLDCRYLRQNKLVTVEFSITLTAAVTATLTMTTPTTAAAAVSTFLGDADMLDISSGTERIGVVELISGSLVRFSFENATPQRVSASAILPFTWASPDKLVGMFHYREV